MMMSPGRRSMFIGLHEFAADAPAVPGASGATAPPDRSRGALFNNTMSYVF